MDLDAFFFLHAGLPRQGPGSDASTLQAIDALPPLPAPPRVLDLGCGPGKQTLVLARTFETPIVAIDNHQPFLDELRATAKAAGLAELVQPRCMSMDALDYPEESVDLIWCEGAAYIIGVENALRTWRPLLKPGGALAFTELAWLTEQPPAEASEFLMAGYPAMTDVAGNVERAEAAGYKVLKSFLLPPDDWWNEYYNPLRERMAALRPRAAEWPELATVFELEQQETDLFERYHESYGYVFYVLHKAAR